MGNKAIAKLIDSKERSKIELCILWTFDDAFAEGYGSAVINPDAKKLAEDAAAELEELKDNAVSLRLEELTPLQEQIAAQEAAAKHEGWCAKGTRASLYSMPRKCNCGVEK